MKNVRMVTLSRSLSQAAKLLCASMTLYCTSHNLDYVQLQTSLCWIKKWPFNSTVSSGKLEEAITSRCDDYAICPCQTSMP